MQLHEEILELLRKKSKAEFEYINPHFLFRISEILSDYYDIEDDDVDRWIRDMFGA